MGWTMLVVKGMEGDHRGWDEKGMNEMKTMCETILLDAMVLIPLDY